MDVVEDYTEQSRMISNVDTSDIPSVQHRGGLQRIFPFGFCYELRELLALAVPIALTSLTNYLFGPISIMFCGHLGSFELATAGLAISVFNVTGLAVAMGLLTACDTLFAQIFGSNELDKMGLNLQRSILLMTICCLPCWSIHLVAEPILLALKQNPLISKHTAIYLTYMLPSLPFAAMGQIFTKYVQAQKHTIPPLIIGTFSNLVNALLHYLLLYKTNMGINGSAVAQSLAYITQTVCFLIYTRCHHMNVITWKNYSTQLLDDWGLWFKLAVPGLFMVTLEWTIFEIGSLVAGVLGEQELAAQTIIYNLESMTYTLMPLGVGLAASIRVGHFLGSRCPIGPRSVTSVSFITTCVLSVPFIIVFVALRWQIPRLFTDDKKVIELAANTLPILGVFQLFDSIVGVLSGVVRGAGLQYIGAIICVISLYLIGAPLGMVLAFVVHTNIQGLWWGLCVGLFVSAIMYFLTVFRIDWNKQVERTMERIHSATSTTGGLSSNYGTIRAIGQTDEVFLEVEIEDESMPNTDASTQLIAPKRLNTTVILNRVMLLLGVLILFIVGVVCRTSIPLQKYFGIYCLHTNGTFDQFWNTTEADAFAVMENCTVIVP